MEVKSIEKAVKNLLSELSLYEFQDFLRHYTKQVVIQNLTNPLKHHLPIKGPKEIRIKLSIKTENHC